MRYKQANLIRLEDGTFYVSPGWRIHTVLDPDPLGNGGAVMWVLLEKAE